MKNKETLKSGYVLRVPLGGGSFQTLLFPGRDQAVSYRGRLPEHLRGRAVIYSLALYRQIFGDIAIGSSVVRISLNE